MNVYDIDKRFYLIDLPGYGYARKSLEQREKFAEMILNYLGEVKQLRLVLLIVDARIPPSDLDAEMLDWLQREKISFVLIMNKIDKVKKADIPKLEKVLEEKYPGVRRIAHSVGSEKQRKEILVAIEESLHSKK